MHAITAQVRSAEPSGPLSTNDRHDDNTDTSLRYVCVATLTLAVALAVHWAIPVAGATIVVRADDDLQAAIERARPGDTLLLEAGATFTGNFVLPDKGGTRPILIRSARRRQAAAWLWPSGSVPTMRRCCQS